MSTAVFVGRAVDSVLAILLSYIDKINSEKRFLTLTTACDFETRCRLFNETLRKGHESQRLLPFGTRRTRSSQSTLRLANTF